MAEPIYGPNAIPATEVNPNKLMGNERALSPSHTSLIDPPTILIATEEPPPPKNRVTTIVAKFLANAVGNKNISKTM